MAIASAIFFFLVALPAASLMNGWAISVLWNWFMMPYLHFPALNVLPAMGVALTVGMMTKTPNVATEKQEWYERLIGVFIGPLVAIGLGWLLRLFL
jgi:ACR3 family arsenite efflux pump ArsB